MWRWLPIYDMLTILACDRCANHPPGMYVDGRKSWDMSKALWRYLQQQLNLAPPVQRQLADRVCSAVSAVVPELKHHIRHTTGFEPVGLRMLWEWNEGMKRLQTHRTFALPDWAQTAPSEGLPAPPCRRRSSQRCAWGNPPCWRPVEKSARFSPGPERGHQACKAHHGHPLTPFHQP